MSSLHRPVIPFLALLALGVAAGFWAGRLSLSSHLAERKASPAASNVPPPGFPDVSAPAPEIASAPKRPLEKLSAADWAASWAKLGQATASPRRDKEMIAALEVLAKQDPRRAASLALEERNLMLRASLVQAVLQIWAATDPERAAKWVLANKEVDHGQAISAVLTVAAEHPQSAIDLASRLAKEDPSRASEYSICLINALSEGGEFKMAADFAARADFGEHVDLLSIAYGNWGRYQPQAASRAAAEIADAEFRKAAEEAVVSGWSQADPKGLANFASQLPTGEFRTMAMTEGLRTWVMNDPSEAADWMDRFEAGPELDAGVMAVATLPNVINHPDIALSWAETISDPSARSRTVQEIVEDWAHSQPVRARRYAETTSNLTAEDRASLLENLTRVP